MFRRPSIWNQCAAFGAITSIFVTLASYRVDRLDQSVAGLTLAVGCALLASQDLRAR